MSALRKVFSGTNGLVIPKCFSSFGFFFLWNSNSLIIFKLLSVLLMGGFGLWESLPERGKSVVCIDGLDKVARQKSYKDPWGLKPSLMARHELEKFCCSFKVLWGAKWPWNSLDIRNYRYDWQVYFPPSPQLCQVQLMLFFKESEEQISLNWRWYLCFYLLSLGKA